MSTSSIRYALTSGAVCFVAVLTFADDVSGVRQSADRQAPAAVSQFARDAGGAPAVEDRRLVIRGGAAGSFGLINSISFCPGIAYLSDPWRIYELSLTDGRITRVLEDSQGSRSPETIGAGVAADCDAGVLYRVEHFGGVAVLRLSDGARLRMLPRPPAFTVSAATPLFDGGRVFVPGLWSSAPGQAVKNGRTRFYEGAKLGWSVDIATGSSTPVLDPLEPSCAPRAPDDHCFTLPVDHFQRGSESYWVYAQGSGASFAIADEARARINRISVASPKFTRGDGAAVARSPTFEESLRWGTTNSRISHVYAAADGIAVVHSLNATTTPPIQFVVYVNLYDRSGKGLIADLRLPDLPIGRDSTNLYVVDYGSAGRREDAMEIALVTVPLSASRQSSSLDRR